MTGDKMKTALEFIPNVARKAEGLSDAGIEQFRDNPYVSCGRETGQNTNDAPDAGKRPVLMKFDLRVIKRKDVPFADELAEATKACLKESLDLCNRSSRNPSKDRTVRFFERAVDSLSDAEIKILEIADFNTTGLTGPLEDEHSVFNSLVKAKGVTNKQDIDSGGSFGIGKNAVFAVSDVQTVLYSTKAKNIVDITGPDIFGVQARTVLISHENNGKSKAAEGYWGLPDFYPIQDPEVVPNWMVREDRGTSIFAVCFRVHESWAERMALSIATNFQVSVMRGEMEFEIDNGRFKINKSTLLTILHDKGLEKVAKEANQMESLDRARNIFECLTSELRETYLIPVDGYGKARLHILVQDKLPRRVNIMRNGMFITNTLKYFGCPLQSFPGTREFVAVVEPESGPEGKALGELLKRMENPEHDNFSPERLRDDEERVQATKLIKQLHADIRNKIRSAAKVAESDQSNLDELARLFAADPDTGESKEGVEKDPESYTYGKAKVTKKKPVNLSKNAKGTAGGSGGSGGSAGGSGGGQGGGSGSGTGGTGKKGKARHIKLSDCRNKREPAGNHYSHRILFTPEESGAAKLVVKASGLTNASALVVSGADRGTVASGSLALNCKKGKRLSVAVNFENEYDGPLEFECLAPPSEDVS